MDGLKEMLQEAICSDPFACPWGMYGKKNGAWGCFAEYPDGDGTKPSQGCVSHQAAERIAKLEQLCRDMWNHCLVCMMNECAVAYWDKDGTHEQEGDYETCTIGRRMESLGLLEGRE